MLAKRVPMKQSASVLSENMECATCAALQSTRPSSSVIGLSLRLNRGMTMPSVACSGTATLADIGDAEDRDALYRASSRQATEGESILV